MIYAKAVKDIEFDSIHIILYEQGKHHMPVRIMSLECAKKLAQDIIEQIAMVKDHELL
jgi:hypothetical protein